MKLILLLVLASCSSPKALMKDKPTISYDSEKSPQKLKECLNEKLGDINQVHSVDVDGGHTVSMNNGFGKPLFVAKITSKESGSRMDYYESWATIRTRSITESLASCK
jgi:hypothetical protein